MEELKGKSFLKLLDFTPSQLETLLHLSARLKELKKAGLSHRWCEGKNIVLLFEKTSTRTRCAFEVAGHDLGMGVTYLDPASSQMGQKESIADTARVLGRMFDGIQYRGYQQQTVEQLAQYAGVPVWNGLTDEFHPTQILADFLTIREHLGRLNGVRLVYMGDARFNMGRSLMVGCAQMGLHFVACAPREFWPDKLLVEECQQLAKASGGSITLEKDVNRAVPGADVVYTDIWVSMGEPEEVWAQRIQQLLPYQVNQQVMELAGPQAVFMHCLPAFHDWETKIGRKVGQTYGLEGLEVTNEVFEGSQSIVFDQAENRLHTIKAVMAATLADPLHSIGG